MKVITRAGATCGLVAASTALALAGVAVAKTQVVKDPKDSPGNKLEIKRATAGQMGTKGRTLVHTVSFRSRLPRNPDGNVCVYISKRKPPPQPDGEGPPPPPPPEGDHPSLLPPLPIPMAGAGPSEDDGSHHEGDSEPPDSGPLFAVCTAPGKLNARRVDVMRTDTGRVVGKAKFRRRGSRKVELSFAKEAIGLDAYYWKVTTGYNGAADSPCPTTDHGFGCFDDTKVMRFDPR